MIKSILGGKSKNLCDIAYLLTLPLDKTFSNQGFWRVLINAEPNTTYTFSRENANQITEFGISYLAISTYDDTIHNYWLSHDSAPVLNYKSTTLTTSSDGKLWILFNENFYKNYWQKNLNPVGYIQLELGSTATEYVPHELTSYKSIMKVRGGWQLVDKSKFTASGTINGITWVSNGDGSITLNGTCTDGFALNPFNQRIPVDQTHFYYTSPYLSINYGGRIDGTYETGGIGYIKTSAQPTKFNTVFYIWIDKDKSFSNVTTFINIDDLTEIFGAGNEPKTVAEFKAKFPNDYYPYSPGRFVTSFDERMPCKTKNLFDINANSEKGYYDEQGNFYPNDRFLCFTIDVISNNTYCISTGKLGSVKGIVSFWNNNTFVSAVNTGEQTAFAYTVPSGANKLKFVIEANQKYSNIQIEKGTTATDYVPYGYV